MTYALALLFLVCVYVRPADIFPAWEGFPFVGMLAGLSAVSVVGSLIVRPRRFCDLPHDGFVLGFFVAIVASNAAWGWFFGAYQATLTMAPVIFGYFLLRSAVKSPAQLRGIGYTVVGLTLFLAVNGIVQFHTGFGIGDIAPVEMASFSLDAEQAPHADDSEDQSEVRRIRGAGIFNDPNDLALALVIATPFLAGPLARRSTGRPGRVLASVLLVPIMVALYYTNSRGGILGLGAALLPYLYRRFGKVAGPVVAVAGLAALLLLGPSRMSALDASESSAQDRIQSWSEGLQMFKARPLFGVGFGRYTEFNELVAHNSFVHTLGELGLAGAFCFVGMGYWFFQGTRRRVDLQPEDGDRLRLRAWGDDLRQSGLGLIVCAMFLSRQYDLLPFVWLALSGCYLHVLRGITPAPAPRIVVHGTRIAAMTAGAIVCTLIVVRLFAIWQG
jgi:putative inorganic carbon (HCO3(-)) transporter